MQRTQLPWSLPKVSNTAGSIRNLLLHLFFGILFTTGATAAPSEPLKIGALFSLTSWAADGGTAELAGLQMAVADINAQGGILGRSVELIIEDNASDLRATATAFKKLASVDRVAAVIGPNWAEFSEIAAPLAHSMKVPTISPSGYRESLFKTDGFFFSLLPPPEAATKVLAQELLAKKYKTISIMVTENSYLLGILEALSGQLRASSTPPKVSVFRFNPGHQDYRSTITQLKQDPPDATVSLLLLNSDLVPFIKQVREMKFSPPMYVSNDIVFDSLILENPTLANDVIYFDYVVPGSAAFLRRYRIESKREPNFGSAKAYDALFLVKKSAELCGLAAEDIARCLRQIGFAGESGEIRFSSSGQIRWNLPNTALFRITDGKFVGYP